MFPQFFKNYDSAEILVLAAGILFVVSLAFVL
jgi:hypothetical protein